MAERVLRAGVARGGLDGLVHVSSSGTSDAHSGDPMDHRAAATLASHGYDPSDHRATHFEPGRLPDLDLVLAMDLANHSTITRTAHPDHHDRVMLFRDFDPLGRGGEVPDPYYGGSAGFEEVLSMVERTCSELVRALRTELRVSAEIDA